MVNIFEKPEGPNILTFYPLKMANFAVIFCDFKPSFFLFAFGQIFAKTYFENICSPALRVNFALT